MIWRLMEGQDVTPKYYVSACPKHGLHLAAMLVQGYVDPMPASIYNANHWNGTFKYNSFIPVWQEMGRWFFIASRLQQGYFYQGHVGYRHDIADFLRLSRAAFVFIYRDLRDVAVSMAHHIASPDGFNRRHPAKGPFHALGGFDEILAATITGMGPMPGVVGLWELYEPWLAEDWIHAIRFEDALADLEGAAKGIIEYGLRRITDGIWEDRLVVEQSIVDKAVSGMANLAGRKGASPTFRKGQPGEWRETFTDEHLRLFDEAGGNAALERIGYEV